MPSVGLGWWYHIAARARRGTDDSIARADSFMNGDPVGVDVHQVDERVVTCPLSPAQAHAPGRPRRRSAPSGRGGVIL